MTPLRRRPRQAIVTGAVLFALTIASACGSDRADDEAAPAAAFDQGLHDRLPAAILKRGTVCVGGSDPYPRPPSTLPTAGPSSASSPTSPPSWHGCSACGSSSST